MSQARKARKRRIKGILFILLMFSIWTGYTGYHQWTVLKEKKSTYAQLKTQEKKALETKMNLEKRVLQLKDREYIAEMARKYYFLSKPGEIIIISPEE